MKTTNTFGVRFFIKKDKIKNGKAPIYARVTVNGKSVDISLKREINTAVWNPDRECVKGSRDEIKSTNTYIDLVRTKLTNCYSELKINKDHVTAVAIKNLFCGVVKEEHTLLNLIEYHNTHLNSFLEWGTMKNYGTTQKYIELFLMEVYKTSDVQLSRLNYSFIVNFEIFLKERQPVDHHKPCGHNTVLKHIERVRKMINVAIKNEWLERDPFAKYRARFIKNDREFLSQQELELLENKEHKIVRLQWAKDLFVFSCYTGFAYVDVASLTTDHIKIDDNGKKWLIKPRQKTGITEIVPLFPPALRILNKYDYSLHLNNNKKLLPVPTNQKVNAYLKELADICGIQTKITFHVARHTFASTVTLDNGIPIDSVRKMLGHRSIKTTQIYAKVSDKKIRDDTKILFRKFRGK